MGAGMTDENVLPMAEYRRAGLEITRGNADVYKSLWSRRDDVTLANPFGSPVRGWEAVSARLDLAAGNYRDGRDYEFDNVSTVITPELAYTVEIERIRTRVGGSEELTPIAIRATTVFRREDGIWKVTHRHGDPITSMRTAESVLQD
jgi:ketosteroid isomerase-like protein